MQAEDVLRVGQEALWLAVVLSAPAVLAAMVIGLAVAVFQAATQLQEATLSAVPKIVAVFATLAVLGIWMLHQALRFTAVLWESIGEVGIG